MRNLASLIIVTLCANAAHAEQPERGVSADQPDRWELTAAAGAASMSLTSPGMVMGNSTDRAEMSGSVVARDVEPTALFALRYRVTDRVVWSIPTLSFAYLGGSAERALIPWAGLVSWGAGYSSIEHFIAQGQLGAGVGVRQWLASSTALNFTAAIESGFRYTSEPLCPSGGMCRPEWSWPDSWRASATAGMSRRASDMVTLNLGVGASGRIATDERGANVSIGSIQAVGLRLLPLVQAQVAARWSLDGYAAVSYDLDRERVEQRYLVGFTWSTAAR
jgi:hypothetical protein